jgi:hypothetical protein
MTRLRQTPAIAAPGYREAVKFVVSRDADAGPRCSLVEFSVECRKITVRAVIEIGEDRLFTTVDGKRSEGCSPVGVPITT